MKETQSQSSEQVFLLEELAAITKHADQIIAQSTRSICILSERLDPGIYDQEDLVNLVSKLARSDRNADVRILVKDVRSMLEQGHRLLNLSRRLSSKVHIRRLLADPEDARHSYLIGDRERLLYLHEDGVYKGFADYQAAPKVRQLLEDFNRLWEHHSEASPDLRRMHL